MLFFAMFEDFVHNSSDGGPDHFMNNARIGGYKQAKRAVAAIRKRSGTGRILNEYRQIVALVENGKITFKMDGVKI